MFFIWMGRQNIMSDTGNMSKNQRKEYLRTLREGLPADPNSVETLKPIACTYGDQTIQKAALTGLTKHATTEAVLGIARRLLDPWGMGALSHSIRMCCRLGEQGGLVLLAATLFHDDRFIHEKLAAITKLLMERDDKLTIRQLEQLGDESELHREPRLVNEWRKRLQATANLEIREGIIFGSQFEGTCGVIGQIPAAFSPEQLFRARRFVDSRIPGIESEFEDCLPRM